MYFIYYVRGREKRLEKDAQIHTHTERSHPFIQYHLPQVAQMALTAGQSQELGTRFRAPYPHGWQGHNDLSFAAASLGAH